MELENTSTKYKTKFKQLILLFNKCLMSLAHIVIYEQFIQLRGVQFMKSHCKRPVFYSNSTQQLTLMYFLAPPSSQLLRHVLKW